MRRVAYVLTLACLLAGCGSKGGDEGSAGWTGRYRATTAQGTSEITLEERGDLLTLRGDGDEAVGHRVAGGRFEGEKTGPEGTLRFVFERRGAQVAARFTLTTPDGQTQEAPEVLYTRVEEGAGESAGGGGGGGNAGGGGGERPQALVGHWRFTETFARDDISWATDTHLVLEADGSCRSWSRTEGSVSSSDPETQGLWKAEGNQLLLKLDGGGSWQPAARFAADGERLMLTLPNGDKQVFERL